MARLWQLGVAGSAASSIILGGHAAEVTGVLIDPPGLWAVTASADATVMAWDLQATRRAVGELRGHRGPIVALAGSLDGLSLATGSLDGTARLWRTQLWNLSLDQLVERACAAAGRNLGEAHWRQYIPNRPDRVVCPGLPIPEW